MNATEKIGFSTSKKNNWHFEHRRFQLSERYVYMNTGSKEVCVIQRNESTHQSDHYICLLYEKEDDCVLELRVFDSLDKDWQVFYVTSALENRSKRFVKPEHFEQLNEVKKNFLPLLLQSNRYRLGAVTGAIRIANDNLSFYL